jgi:hypothetical protein
VICRAGLATIGAPFLGGQLSPAAIRMAMFENEGQPVLKALRANNLDVVAIHQHIIATQPAIIFLDYWGTGPAEELAAGFRAALDRLGKTKAAPHYIVARPCQKR